MKFIIFLIALCSASTCYAGDTGTIKVCRAKEPGQKSAQVLKLAAGIRFADASNLSVILSTTAAARIVENGQCTEVAAKVSDNPQGHKLSASETTTFHYAGMPTAAENTAAPDDYARLHAMIVSGFED